MQNRPKHINLTYELMQLCLREKDGSYATQAARKDVLSLCAEQLKTLGFYNLHPTGLKPKHVEGLIKLWQSEEKSAGTIKNRMSHLRWWAKKIDKQNVIARDNKAYGIAERVYITNQTKAVQLEAEKLAKINDEYIKCSLELQKAFGLRREECIKFQPQYADRGDKIALKGTWTKGGKPREIPIRNDYQKEALAKAHRVAGGGSMIPSNKLYVDQLRKYEGVTKSIGLSKLHGLRHHYAQERYKELTNFESPARGGKTSKELSRHEKQIDQEARFIISQELGHEREEITAVYLGR